MNKPSITLDPTQVKKDLGEFYSVINRHTIHEIWSKSSPLAVSVYVLIDTHTNGHGQHVTRDTLLRYAPCSIRTLDRGITELKKLGYLKVTRHLGSNYYELTNPVRNREEVAISDHSKSPNLSTLNRSKDRSKINTGENRSASSASGLSLDEKGYKKFSPYRRLTEEKRSYVDEFNLHLERNLSERIDVYSLKTKTINALIEAKDLGLTPLELARECSLLVNKEVTARARRNRPLLENQVGYLIDQLPEWVSYKLWSNKSLEVPDSIPDSEHLPHTVRVSQENPLTEDELNEIIKPLTEEELERIENQRIETNLMLENIRLKTRQPSEVALMASRDTTLTLTRLRKRYPDRSKSELKAIYFSQTGATITDEELDL